MGFFCFAEDGVKVRGSRMRSASREERKAWGWNEGFKKMMATWVRSFAESGRMNSKEEILAPTDLRDGPREGRQTRMHGTRKKERGGAAGRLCC